VPQLLLQDFPSGLPPPAQAAESARLDDPMSVVAAVYTAMQRMRTALDFDLYCRAANEVRESVFSCAGVLFLWTYAVLLARPWQLPGCAICAVVVFFKQASEVARRMQEAEPLRLLGEDGGPYGTGTEKEKLSLKERGKENIRKAVNMEISLMRFARTLTGAATQLEKVRFVVTLRDPYISMVCAGLLFGASTVLATAAWVLSFVPFQLGIPLVVWAVGAALLLPGEQRARVRRAVFWLKAQKERRVGRDRLGPKLRNLWQRIPDSLETQHLDLFEGCLLLPPAPPPEDLCS